MKKSVKKSLMLMVSLLLIVGVTVGGTIAFLITQTGDVTNIFKPSEVTVEVNETFDGTTKSNVSIKNTGDTTAYIRAAVIVTWQDGQGNVYGVAPKNSDYTITYKTEDNDPWFEGSDGYYYHKASVEAGKNTGILIEKAEVKGAAPASGYSLCIEILASGIQSVPDEAVEQAWTAVKVGVNGLEPVAAVND